jgi:hypothetical protein
LLLLHLAQLRQQRDDDADSARAEEQRAVLEKLP